MPVKWYHLPLGLEEHVQSACFSVERELERD